VNQRPYQVNCPTCNEIVPWTEASTWRPFCSERCKLIDFGEWASGRHSIPGELVDPEQLPPGSGTLSDDE